MAKVTGPLHSDSASGSHAGSTVFSHWKGRPYARMLVIPVNRKSDGQAEARLYMGSCGKNNKAIQSISGGAVSDSILYTQIMAKTPSDQSWMSFFQKTQIGKMFVNILAARADWTSCGAPQKAFFTTAAATIPLTGFDIGYGVVVAIAGDEQLFISAYAAFSLGLAIAPSDPKTMTESQVNAFAAAYKV